MTMNFSEFVGFIITMIAFVLLIGKQSRDARKRRQNPEAYEQELADEEEKIQSILKSLDLEDGKGNYHQMAKPSQSEPTPPPPPINAEEVQLVKEAKKGSAMEDDFLAYKSKKQKLRKFIDIHAKDEKGITGLLQKEDGAENTMTSTLHRDLEDKETIKRAVILREILGPPKGL